MSLGDYRAARNAGADMSAQLEESLMQALRQIEATIDSVVTVLSNSIPGFVTANNVPDPEVSAIQSTHSVHVMPRTTA